MIWHEFNPELPVPAPVASASSTYSLYLDLTEDQVSAVKRRWARSQMMGPVLPVIDVRQCESGTYQFRVHSLVAYGALVGLVVGLFGEL